jgi:hypothetical protein
MRRVRMTAGVLVALFALTATPALAKEFTTSRLPKECSTELPCKTVGRGIGSPEEAHPEYTQKFKFGGFTILCKKGITHAKTPAEGAPVWSTSQTYATEVKFGECGTVAHFGPNAGLLRTQFNGGLPVKFLWHVNGFAELGSEETASEVEVGGGTTTFTIAGKICKIGWPAQTVPAVAEKKPAGEYSAAVYSNTEVPVEGTKLKKFPSGFQHRLIIANEFKGMKYTYEEGQCMGEGGFEEEFKGAEAKSGLFIGTFEEEVVGGNLGFNP